MKVTFEFDDNIIEETELESTLFFNKKLKNYVGRKLKDEIVEIYKKTHPKFDDLGITKEEIKKAVIEKIAEDQTYDILN